MTVRRLVAIGVIFVGAAVAWFTLGSTVVVRSGQSSSAMSSEVAQLWGGQHAQAAPEAVFDRPRETRETVKEKDESGAEITRVIEKIVYDRVLIPITATRAEVDLQLEHRRKGLLWHDTYGVDFDARYTYRIPDEVTGPVHFTYRFPSAQAIYDGFALRIDGREVLQDIHFAFVLASLVSIALVVSYLRLVCGIGPALRFAGATQLVFLVLFSYAFFFEGYTGLTVTIAAVLTLFLLMQLTGKVDCEKAFQTPPETEPTRGVA